MVGRIKLTRNQLASFLNDSEQIKQFENLFSIASSAVTVDADTLDDGDYIYWDATLQEWIAAAPEELSKVDDTNVTLTLAGTPSSALFKSVSMTLGWAGTLAVARGGTGAGTPSGAMDNLGSGRALAAGAGLTGGGDLSANRTFDIGAGTGITVNADDVAISDTAVTPGAYGSASQVGAFTVDQQGRLTAAGNVAITPAAIGGVPDSRTLTAGAGLTGGGDLSANRTFDVGAGTGITVNANDVALDTSSARNVDHSGVTLTAGAGLTGGGTIEASRTFDVGAGTGITVNANDVALDTGSTRNTDHAGVTLTAGAGLTGGGDISANRSFAVGAGTGITVNADDVALADTAVTPASYGSATSVPSFTVDQQGRLTAASGNTIPTLAAGTYTPTLTNTTNIAASTASECQYMRVGNVVTVSGRVAIDPTAAGAVELDMTLPIASNFGTVSDLGGTFNSRNTAIALSGAVSANAAADEARFAANAASTANTDCAFIFAYEVI